MPYPNQHACRLRDPGGFQDGSFRTVHRTSGGKRYSIIMGRLTGSTSMTEQAYRYDKNAWSAAQARGHCGSHGGRFEAAGPGTQAEEYPELVAKFVQSNRNYQVREQTHQGRRHLIVPVVMMVEGVHNGSHGPLLHPAEELGRWPGAWNGIPVVVNHPEVSGMSVSANDPQIIDRETVGRVYNTRMDGERLRAEAWIDEERLRQVSAVALGAIRQGHPLEVSVGVFTDDDQSPGTWNGEEYEAVARNHRPDHLALLPGGEGACSWEDGCGVRLNEKGGNVMEINTELLINALRYSGTETTAWSAPTLADFNVGTSWEALSAADKAKVASHYLIGSSAAATFGDLKLPVVNPSTGKLSERALRAVIGGRGAAVGGVSAEQRSAARRRAYRLLNSEFGAGLTIPETLEELKLLSLDQLLDNADEDYKQLIENTQRKLDSMDGENKLHFLEELHDDYVIYRVSGNGETHYYKQSYQTLDDGGVDFVGHPTEMRKQIEYVAALQRRSTNNKSDEEVTTMSTEKKDKKTPCENCEKLVNELITNERTKWTEEDKEFLLTLEEDKLVKLIPEREKEPEKPEPVQVNKEEAMKVLRESVSKPEEFFKILPPELRGSMESGLKLFQERNAQMIEAIKKETDAFTDEELKAMTPDILAKTHKAIVESKVDYTPLSGIETHAADTVEPLIPAEHRKPEKKEE